MIEIVPAAPHHLEPLRSLLASAGLPTDVGEHAGTAVIVALDGERLCGGVAVEPYGSDGLLRSLVVVEARRGRGLGRLLTDAARRSAAEAGFDGLYLLTETAAGFFEREGFVRVPRREIPAAVAASTEFTVLCPDTAVAMTVRA